MGHYGCNIYIYIHKYGTTWVNIVYNIEYYGFSWAAITDMVDIRHAHQLMVDMIISSGEWRERFRAMGLLS